MCVCVRVTHSLPASDLLHCYVKALSLGPYSIMLIQRENIISQITETVVDRAAVMSALCVE